MSISTPQPPTHPNRGSLLQAELYTFLLLLNSSKWITGREITLWLICITLCSDKMVSEQYQSYISRVSTVVWQCKDNTFACVCVWKHGCLGGKERIKDLINSGFGWIWQKECYKRHGNDVRKGWYGPSPVSPRRRTGAVLLIQDATKVAILHPATHRTTSLLKVQPTKLSST